MNLGLLHCRQILYHLSHQGSPWPPSVQFSSVPQSCLTLCDPMDCSTSGLPVYHQLPQLIQTYDHWVGDDIQPSHPLLSPSPPAFNLFQHKGLFQWVSSSHQVAKVLELQLQHQSFQWIFQVWFPLGWTGLISLQSKGLSRVFSSTTVLSHQFQWFPLDPLIPWVLCWSLYYHWWCCWAPGWPLMIPGNCQETPWTRTSAMESPNSLPSSAPSQLLNLRPVSLNFLTSKWDNNPYPTGLLWGSDKIMARCIINIDYYRKGTNLQQWTGWIMNCKVLFSAFW